MSVASIEHTTDEIAAQSHDHDVVHPNASPDRPASLRRPFTRYQPRHRADGPAI